MSNKSNKNWCSYPFEECELTHFHCVGFECWLGVRSFLVRLLMRRLCSRGETCVTMSDDEFWVLQRFVEQMDYLYKHPRRDSFIKKVNC